MQQPFQTPEEFDDEDVDVFPEPPAPRLNAEQLAERSALEVFPGGTGDLDSDEWWQSTEEAAGSGQQQTEPIEFAAQPQRPAEASSADWIASNRDDSASREQAPQEQITPLWAPVEPEVADAAIEVEAEIEPESPVVAEAPLAYSPEVDAPFEESWQEAPTPTPADAVPRSAMSMPLLSGREQRVASGASQRAAILAQAGVTDFQETDDSIPNAEAFPESQRKHAAASQAKQPGQAKKASGRSRVRTVLLSLIVIALGIAALSGGAVATGQGSEVERVTSSLAPDVVQNWISDNISSFGSASTVPEESPITPSTTDIDQPAVTSLNAVIAHTGGNGIPVRSACVPEARTPRVIPEGQPITVIANGVGDCSGWQVVRAGATVSWVESAYVDPLP